MLFCLFLRTNPIEWSPFWFYICYDRPFSNPLSPKLSFSTGNVSLFETKKNTKKYPKGGWITRNTKQEFPASPCRELLPLCNKLLCNSSSSCRWAKVVWFSSVRLTYYETMLNVQMERVSFLIHIRCLWWNSKVGFEKAIVLNFWLFVLLLDYSTKINAIWMTLFETDSFRDFFALFVSSESSAFDP